MSILTGYRVWETIPFLMHVVGLGLGLGLGIWIRVMRLEFRVSIRIFSPNTSNLCTYVK